VPFLQLPLSGDITQTTHPWARLLAAVGNPLDELQPDERNAVAAFLAMLDDIARLKGRQRKTRSRPS
jgi:hypothetical protein